MISVIIWAVWVVYFIVFEGYALWRHYSAGTFSFQVWGVERRWPIVRGLVFAFVVWLAAHFLMGG